jgi:hypothetical protein
MPLEPFEGTIRLVGMAFISQCRVLAPPRKPNTLPLQAGSRTYRLASHAYQHDLATVTVPKSHAGGADNFELLATAQHPGFGRFVAQDDVLNPHEIGR